MTIGQEIGRYRIVEELGRGGMGVVYKARDTLLDRFVALKVLPPDKSSDPERRRRFLQEARSASALNHPGIVAVHDVLAHEGRDVLVMELVTGETLEERLARKKLSLNEALAFAIGIADALAQAHAAGIVHRDLKPSNVMVTGEGVKVLDFGLAKLTEVPFADGEAPTAALEEPELTREAVVLGTVGWMSPEQTRGQAVDARSDIFAFGVLLYEMLTGRHPFRRATAIETLSAIRENEPPAPRSLAPTLPPEIERAVLRCLHKDPARRWQSVSDVGAVIEDLREDTISGRKLVSVPAAASRRRLSLWTGAVIVLVVLTGAIAAVALLFRGPATTRPLELRRLTYDAGATMTPGISPDGNLVVFTSDRAGDGGLDIWVRHINQQEPTRLTTHPADDSQPRFSPDGSRIVFRSQRDGGGIYVVHALGGGLRRVAGRGMLPRFSPDGTRIVYAEDPHWVPHGLLRMFTVPVSGGAPEPLLPGWGVRAPPAAAGPVFSPDGAHVLFAGAPLDEPRKRDWWVAPLAGGEPRSSGVNETLPRIDVVQFPAVWLPGRLLILAGTTIEGVNLYQTGISGDGLIRGPMKALTAGPGMTWLPSVSNDGRIALSRFQWTIHLFDLTLDPGRGEATGPARRITDDAAPKFGFSLTADGRYLAYSTYSGSPENRRGEIRVQDPEGRAVIAGVSLRTPATNPFPRISSDGKLLSWREPGKGSWIAYWAPMDDPVGRELCTGCTIVDFFSDDEHALVDWGRRLSRVRLSNGEETPILEVENETLLDTDLSRDDLWLAVQIGEPDGDVALYVVSLGDSAVNRADWMRVDEGGSWAGQPRWSPDGTRLYYLSARDDFICVWARLLDPATKVPVGDPFPVRHAHGSEMKLLPIARSMWSLDAGGDRLVFNASKTTGDIYTAELERE